VVKAVNVIEFRHCNRFGSAWARVGMASMPPQLQDNNCIVGETVLERCRGCLNLSMSAILGRESLRVGQACIGDYEKASAAVKLGRTGDTKTTLRVMTDVVRGGRF